MCCRTIWRESGQCRRGKLLYESGDLWEDSICCALVFQESFLERDIAGEVIKDYIEAGAYLDKHKKEAQKTGETFLSVDEDVLKISLQWISFQNLAITREAYEAFSDSMVHYEIMEQPPSYDTFVAEKYRKAGFFPILISTVTAVRRVDPVYTKVAHNFGLSKLEQLFKIIVPSVLPNIMTGIHLALGTAWVFLVAGEMVGAQSGLGYLIIDARNNLRMDLLLAAMVSIGAIGILLDFLIGLLEKRIVNITEVIMSEYEHSHIYIDAEGKEHVHTHTHGGTGTVRCCYECQYQSRRTGTYDFSGYEEKEGSFRVEVRAKLNRFFIIKNSSRAFKIEKG